MSKSKSKKSSAKRAAASAKHTAPTYRTLNFKATVYEELKRAANKYGVSMSRLLAQAVVEKLAAIKKGKALFPRGSEFAKKRGEE